jgi:hypothetical protein
MISKNYNVATLEEYLENVSNCELSFSKLKLRKNISKQSYNFGSMKARN